MKKLQYTLMMALLLGSVASLSAQTQIFNDTIYFQIRQIKQVGNDFKYLMDFQGADNTPSQNLSGVIVLSMCGCYCDSIWDAWPSEIAGGTPPGTATLSYSSGSGNSPGAFGAGGPGRQRGRLNIWQMPGSFLRDDPFTLPVVLKLD